MKQRCLGCMAEYESSYGICPYCGYEPGMPADNPLHLCPGVELIDRYTIGRVLGCGGFGVTYVGFDNLLSQKIAVKEYLPNEFATRMAGDSQVSVFSGNKAEQFADGMLKFLDEAKRLAKLQNAEGVVRVFDSFETNQTAYIVMEYLEGETLAAYLEREGKIPPEQAVSMLKPAFSSLEIVHQVGIIHRDIAPDNIFLSSDGRVKLIDFGAARYATTSHSRSLTVIIKQGYSPEEQYRSRGDQGPHTDVYALAAVLYRMVTGITPPDALERRAVLENKKKDILLPPSKYCKIGSNQENAILNAMNVRVEDRTASAQTFWAELTSEAPVKRRGNRIKALDWGRWPLGLKIGIPVLGLGALSLLGMILSGVIGPESVLAGNITMEEGMTRVPSVINYSVGEAEKLLDQKRLNSLVSGRQQSDVIPAGMVLSQSVDAGQVVEVETQIQLYISEQPEPQSESGRMPDVMYYAEADAVERLRQLGVEPKLEYTYSSEVAEGLVMEQSVTGGDELPQNTGVVLTISRGPSLAQKPADSEAPQNSDPVRPLALSRTTLSLSVGGTAALSASGGSGNYQWSSSNKTVAAVSGGTVTAVGSGQTVITVSSGAETASCRVTVQETQSAQGAQEYGLSLSAAGAVIRKGGNLNLTVSGVPAGTAISWSSSNSSAATVQNGLVTAVGVGEAVITAQAVFGGKTEQKTCHVTVVGDESSETEAPGTITDSGNPLAGFMQMMPINLPVGGTASVSIDPMVNGSPCTVTWSSSNPSVAEISGSGQITAITEGTAVMTARVSQNGQLLGAVDAYVVTVSASPDPSWGEGDFPMDLFWGGGDFPSPTDPSPDEEDPSNSTVPFWEEEDFDYESYLDEMWGPIEG